MTLFWFEVCIDNIKINIKDHTGKYCENNIYLNMLMLQNQIYFFFPVYLRSKAYLNFYPRFHKSLNTLVLD